MDPVHVCMALIILGNKAIKLTAACLNTRLYIILLNTVKLKENNEKDYLLKRPKCVDRSIAEHYKMS